MLLAQRIIKVAAVGNEIVMTPCPSRSNCVSSIAKDRKHYIEPLRFAGSAENARFCLINVLSALKRTRVVKSEKNYLQAEFVSAIMRFVDDVEFFIDAHEKVIHVKSASRVGYYDLGVNRRRVEKIRKLFNVRINHGQNH